MRSPTYELTSFSVATPEEKIAILAALLDALVAINASFPAASVMYLRGRA
jgi:hypothetical protein